MRLRYIIAVIIFALLSGCGTPPSFYMLTPKAKIKNGEIPKGKEVVGISTVSIPDYLNRKEIMTKTGSAKLSMHNNQLWASNLAENIQNVLKIDLSAKTDRYTFLSYPWEEPVDDIYRVYLSIDTLDIDDNGEIRVSGRWSIVNMNSRSIVVSKEFAYSEIINSQDYESMAEAVSGFIDKISRNVIKYL